jgi:hypothetical protein
VPFEWLRIHPLSYHVEDHRTRFAQGLQEHPGRNVPSGGEFAPPVPHVLIHERRRSSISLSFSLSGQGSPCIAWSKAIAQSLTKKLNYCAGIGAATNNDRRDCVEQGIGRRTFRFKKTFKYLHSCPTTKRVLPNFDIAARPALMSAVASKMG